MANNTSFTIKGEVKIDGLKEGTQEAKKLNAELSKIAKPVAAAKAPSKALAAAKDATELRDYGVIRSVRPGGTGASARDFAQEAQGLGGLVRLYATYAANLFAVSAAYAQLEQAASKSRMIEASERMSNRVGISMINLAKDIQQATSYAISLEEALQFGNLGSSAGIAAAQLKNLVIIAKGAANVLGRDVNDSVRRIIQGTSKQEQEILDELGIFVKAKDAYDKYAKEMDIKGGGDALSAQQKVIAYSKAVEEAGQKWKDFAQVDDPFSRFAAKGKEAIFSILEAVNTVFVPILKLLSESSDGIAALALLVSTKLTKQALPQLGLAFKEALTFGKLAKEAEIENQFRNLNDQFVKANAELKLLKDQREKILQDIFDPKLKSVTKFAEDLGNRSGSMQVVMSGIYGTDKNQKDLSVYKSELDVQNAISSALGKQVTNAKDKEDRLQKTIALGLIEKSSTIDQLVLTDKSKKISAEIFTLIQQSNVERLKAVDNETKLAAQTGIVANLSKQVVAIQGQRGGAAPVSGGKDLGLLASTMSKATAASGAFRAGLASSTNVALQFSAAMQGGVLSSLFGLIKTLPLVVSNISAAGLGLTGLSRFASIAGASIAGLGATASAAFGLILGPIMLLWTAWELFGDKILRATGIIDEHDDALKMLEEQQASSRKEVIAYATAMDLLTKEKEKANLSGDAELALYDRQFQIASNRLSQIDEEIRALEELAKKRKDVSGLGRVDDKGDIKFDTTLGEVAYWYKRRNEAKKTEAAERQVYQNLAVLAEQQYAIESNQIKLTTEQRVEALAAVGLAKKLQEKVLAETAANEAGRVQRESETVKSLIGDYTGLSKELDRLTGKQIKFKDLDKIVNTTLNSIAGNMSSVVAELVTMPNKSTASVKLAAEGLMNYADAAKRAGADIAKYNAILQGILHVSNQLADPNITSEVRANMLSALSAYTQLLSKEQEGINAQLAKSDLNVAKGSKKRIELLKYEELEKSKIYKDAGKVALDDLTRYNTQELALFDAKNSLLIDKSKALRAERRKIETAGQQQEISLLKGQLAEQALLYTEEYDQLAKTREKNLAKAGKDEDLRKDAIKNHETAVERLNSSYRANTSELSKRIEVLTDKTAVDKVKDEIIAEKELAELLAFKLETKKLEQETFLAAEEHSIAMLGYSLEQAEMQGQLSERELADYKLKILRTTEEFNLKKKLYELELSYLASVKELQASAGNYSLEEMRSRMQALAQSYSQSVDQAVESSAKKIGVESLKIEDAAYSDLKQGLASAIDTALFEGGKEGGKKLRNVIEAELRKPFNVLIKAFISDLVSSITGSGSGTSFTKTASTLKNMYDVYNGIGASAASGVGTVVSGYGTATGSSYWTQFGNAMKLTTAEAAEGAAALESYSASLQASGDAAAAANAAESAQAIKAGANAGGYTSTAANYAAGAYGGVMAGRAISSGYSAFGGSGNAAVNVGTAAGAAYGMQAGSVLGPWGAVIGGIIGGLVNVAFGKKLKEAGVKAIMQEGEVTSTQNYQFQKGGWFKGDKWTYSEADSMTNKRLAEDMNQVKEQAIGLARGLGLSSTEIENFSGELRVNLKGVKSNEEAGQRYAEALDNLYHQMVKSTPGFKEYQRAGESVEVTIQRLREESLRFAEAMGLSASTLASTIRDGMLGRVAEAQLGEALAEQIIGSVYNALASGFADQISGAITNLIISPIMTSVLAGGTVSAAVSSVAIDTVLKTAKNAIDAFNQILNDPAIQSMFQQLAGMTKQLTGIIVQPVKNIKTFTSSMLANQNAALEKAKAIAQERFSLEGKLLDLLGNTTKIRERELATINASNRSLQKQIWALEDARKAVDDVFAKLERSIEKEKERVQAQLDLARETEEKARAVFDILKTNIEELLGISAAKMLQSEAKALIQTAITSGQLPDSDKLSEAISVLRDSLETTNYRNAVEERKASTKLANQLSTLQAVVQPQLTEAEQTVALLEGQLTSLDSQLEVAKSSLDALYGIDNSIGNVAELIKQLTDASSQYSIQRTISEALVASAPASVAATQASTSSGYTSSAASTAKQWTAAGYAAKNPDLVRYYNQNSKETWWPDNLNTLNAYLKWHWEGDGKKEKRKFKDGGKYPGGVALVGEEGPELINFENPGMVYTAAETRNLLSSSNNPDQERINKELLEQISMLRYEAQATAIHTGKLHKLLERLSRNGKSLLVTDVTTETV